MLTNVIYVASLVFGLRFMHSFAAIGETVSILPVVWIVRREYLKDGRADA
ncbi:MAG: hypothetical protein K6T91_08885 [Firmicutes bacterium]|nr:hypothetical protein [Bacillota bacterium]